MRLCTIAAAGRGWISGIVVDELVIPVRSLLPHLALPAVGGEAVPSLNRRLLEAGRDAMDQAGSVARQLIAEGKRDDAVPLAEARLGPPLPDPEKIICIGLNYGDHVAEAGIQRPEEPQFFAKFANSLAGPHGSIELPPAAVDSVDYEGELVAFMGASAKEVDPADALALVAGFAVLNDVSSRELQFKGSQWIPGKVQDGFAPVGPFLVTADEVGDPQSLGIRTRLNGELVQDACTASMIFSVAEIVAYLSTLVTLRPGDMISTGTPSGVGLGQSPPRYLEPGDIVEIEIDRLGGLRNEVVAATSPARGLRSRIGRARRVARRWAGRWAREHG